jgi:hypothetical protein
MADELEAGDFPTRPPTREELERLKRHGIGLDDHQELVEAIVRVSKAAAGKDLPEELASAIAGLEALLPESVKDGQP